MRPSQKYPALFSVLLGLLAIACGDSGAPNPPPPPITPEALQIVSGDGQRTATGRPLTSSPLRVRVTGSDQQPLPGATVEWSLTAGQATLDPLQSTTDASGETETRVTIGETVGSIVVRAMVEDLAPVGFSITALDPSAFTSVSAGYSHTCGVTATGAAYCWGSNGRGELGDGTTTNRSTPVLVTGGLTFAAVSAGRSYTCGVTAAATAYCWGENRYGNLGDGTQTPRLSPVPVAGGVSFAAVTAGDAHACGVTAAGAAYCWGLNQSGDLGDGTPGYKLALTPVRVAGDVNFASLDLGYLHTCGVTVAGTAYCWGYNEFGQVGDGTTTDRSTPVLVTGGVSFAAVTVGFINTCGVTAAGAAYCWGANHEGEIGVGAGPGPETCILLGGSTTDCSTAPVPVAGGVSFAGLGRGSSYLHTCGVTAAGAAYCWGLNFEGQLGVGTTTGPELCDGNQVSRPTVACSTVPAPVTGGLSFAEVSVGTFHTCGVTAEGAAYCWGANGVGQLGDGTTTQRSTPVQVVQ